MATGVIIAEWIWSLNVIFYVESGQPPTSGFFRGEHFPDKQSCMHARHRTNNINKMIALVPDEITREKMRNSKHYIISDNDCIKRNNTDGAKIYDDQQNSRIGQNGMRASFAPGIVDNPVEFREAIEWR